VNLILGYFKARRQFFVYELTDVLEDLRYAAALYFPEMDWALIKPLSKPTRLEQQRISLKLFDYRLCDSATGKQGSPYRDNIDTTHLYLASHCSILPVSVG
jgi:hypothetical protein